MYTAPSFVTDNKDINCAYRLAVATVCANILPFKDGLLKEEKEVIIAGLGYNTPWTRDAAINTWNAGGIMYPDIAENTLLAVLKSGENGVMIDGEYWDSIIWTVGAWYQYLYSGSKEFLKTAYTATVNTLEFFEKTEFSEDLGLFRGPACYGDGVAAYPDIYAAHGHSGIIKFAEFNKELCKKTGVGIPMHCLSTNCLYYIAYVIADKMAAELGLKKQYKNRAQSLKDAINEHFWSEEKGNYIYIVDDFGGCDSQEGMGVSFALLFGIADSEQAKKVIKNQHITRYGIPCVYPTFARYFTPDRKSFGRHSGTVWPHIEGFWASAVSKHRNTAAFDREFANETDNALRYMQFAELYHPETGEMYGGKQEWLDRGIKDWHSESFQTWSATAYLRNCLMDIVGMNFTEKGIGFNPVGTTLARSAELKGLKYRETTANIKISGNGSNIKSFKLNGNETEPFLSCNATGRQIVEILLD